MKIKAIAIENFKRLKDVKIIPENSLVIIGGKNMQGKSSVLDGISGALEGKRSLPPDPIHHGAAGAEIILELVGKQDLVITRTFTDSDSYLKVTTKEGAPLRSPQKILDALFNTFIDPLAFEQSTADQQLAIMRGLTGLNFAEIDSDREAAYANRTEVNRKINTAEARLQRMTYREDIDAPVDVQGLLDYRKEMEAEHTKIASKRHELDKRKSTLNDAIAGVKDKQEYIEDLENQLRIAKENLESRKGLMEEAEINYNLLYGELDETVEPDFTDIDTKIAGATEHARLCDENQRYADEQSELEQSRDDADAYTESIMTLDQQKKDMVASVKMPLKGLAFGDDGVTFNDVVFEQCSQAEKLMVSCSIGLALNPELRVLLIRDGSLLDEDSMEIVAKIADEFDAQIWIERVGNADENAIIIEDGMVRK